MPTPSASHRWRTISPAEYDLNHRLAELIVQARAGSMAAFEELYNSTARWLIAQVRLLVNNEQAEDILTDVYLQVWRSLDSYDPQRSPPTAWLRLIVRSRALDHMRRERALKTEALTEDIQSSMRTDDGPDHLAARSQEHRLVQASLSEAPLTSQERMLLALAFFHDRTLSEISAMTGLPLGTVKGSLGRARDKLREQFNASVAHVSDERALRQGAGS